MMSSTIGNGNNHEQRVLALLRGNKIQTELTSRSSEPRSNNNETARPTASVEISRLNHTDTFRREIETEPLRSSQNDRDSSESHPRPRRIVSAGASARAGSSGGNQSNRAVNNMSTRQYILHLAREGTSPGQSTAERVEAALFYAEMTWGENSSEYSEIEAELRSRPTRRETQITEFNDNWYPQFLAANGISLSASLNPAALPTPRNRDDDTNSESSYEQRNQEAIEAGLDALQNGEGFGGALRAIQQSARRSN